MLKILTKADIVLFICLISLGIALAGFSVAGDVTGEKAVVTVDGKLYGTYDLSKDQTVTIEQNGHTNEFSIKNGQVQMTRSTCKNHICIQEGAISHTSQRIVCLPNRVMIEIQGGGEFDAVSR